MEIQGLDKCTLDRAIAEESAVMVEFYTESCPFCKSLERIFQGVAAHHAERAVFAKVNLGQESSLAEQYAIRSVPTVILFVDGSPVARCVGAVSRGKLEEMLTKVDSDGVLAQKKTE